MAEPQLDTWTEETKQIPIKTYDEQGNLIDAVREVKEKVAYTKLTPQNFCANNDHMFEFVDGGKRQGGRVLVKCKHCPVGRHFLVGTHTLENGKLINR